MPESRQDCCDLTASVPCADCPRRKPDAWQIRDKHGRWITLPGDWQESENIEGREYRPLYALPASRADVSGWTTEELMVPNLGWGKTLNEEGAEAQAPDNPRDIFADRTSRG